LQPIPQRWNWPDNEGPFCAKAAKKHKESPVNKNIFLLKHPKRLTALTSVQLIMEQTFTIKAVHDASPFPPFIFFIPPGTMKTILG
jgi:replication-associated recombination protein RarA